MKRRTLLKAIPGLLLVGCLKEPPPLPGLKSRRGGVLLNGRSPKPGETITTIDLIETGPGAEAVFVVDDNALLLRESSHLKLIAPPGPSQGKLLGFHLHRGALLSVFGPGEKRIRTPHASVGVRGTGLYLEISDDRTYACACFGTVHIAPKTAPERGETITAKHHDHPRIIHKVPSGWGQRKAPMIHHADHEVFRLAALAGQKNPFAGMPPMADPFPGKG